MIEENDSIKEAVSVIENSEHISVFTGAGISVESGIPPFRGENGLWKKYDPEKFTLVNFYENPEASWELCKNVFYDLYKKVEPNQAHEILANWEKKNIIESVITQNIDGLHQNAGSKKVFEFHGTYQELICTECKQIIEFEKSLIQNLPPECNNCGGLLKPNFIIFGEDIPQDAYKNSLKEAHQADVFLVIGTTGEVMPACSIPEIASREGADIIEINIEKSKFSNNITDIFLQGKATEILDKMDNIL